MPDERRSYLCTEINVKIKTDGCCGNDVLGCLLGFLFFSIFVSAGQTGGRDGVVV